MTTTADLLTRTFAHVPGIGMPTERALWAEGIRSWRHFLSARSVNAPLRSRSTVRDFLERSVAALEAGDATFFAQYLPRAEWWRLYLPFQQKAVFLDIETTGLSHHYDDLTVVGLYDGTHFSTFIAGHNLNSLDARLRPYDIIITFNGTLFDLPFLKRKLPSIRLPSIHLDLRYILRRIGYSGPLKLIEKQLQIQREEAANVDGLMATVLWARYLHGDATSLEQLLKYNAADITSLQSLTRFCYHRLASRLLGLPSRRSLPSLPRHPRRVPIQVRRTARRTSLLIDGTRMTLRNGHVPSPLVTISHLLSAPPNGRAVGRVVGIDLTGSERRPSGVALLVGNRATTMLLASDDEIEREVLSLRADLVSIDSPLGLPTGRCCTHDTCDCRRHGIVRECERILWRRGVRVYPALLPSMQALTARGMRLAARFRDRGIPVIESYPGAAQDIMRIPRKRTSVADLAAGLISFGILLDQMPEHMSHDELDAVTAATVGLFFWSGRFEALGNVDEGPLIVPSLVADHATWLARRVTGLSGFIAAGKTTAARVLEERGYHYARFSLVLSDLLRERGIPPTRKALQLLGDEINRNPGQRWLCQRLASRLPKDGPIVVDGLRHPMDHAFMVEQFGPGFTHVHVSASLGDRRSRYGAAGGSEDDFLEAMCHPVESNVQAMRTLAHVVVENSLDREAFRRMFSPATIHPGDAGGEICAS